jgi:cyclophilin family peptidyl-prolyl cis-trans isomerase
MNGMFRTLSSLLVLGFVACATAAPPASGAAPVAQAGSFDALFKDWKSMLARMRTLQEKYQVASASERTAIETEFNALRQQGQAMAPRLLAAAEEAYLANPKSNPEIGDFLMAKMADDVRSENYEEARRVGEVLLKKSYADQALLAFLGMAEYATNDFVDAKKHLSEADATGKLKLVQPATEAIRSVDLKAAEWEEEEKIRAAEAKADDLPRVKLTTSKGDIVIELFENDAPNTVANFISLVEKGFYNGLKFHRVIPGFMAQGGCPKGDGTGGPGYTIDCECLQGDRRKHFRGSLSMAHAGPNTGGSQFFLTFVPTPHLDGKHTVFGRVIEGMDVLAKLQRTEGTSKTGTPDKIIKAEVLRKRGHDYVPKKN